MQIILPLHLMFNMFYIEFDEKKLALLLEKDENCLEAYCVLHAFFFNYPRNLQL